MSKPVRVEEMWLSAAQGRTLALAVSLLGTVTEDLTVAVVVSSAEKGLAFVVLPGFDATSLMKELSKANFPGMIAASARLQSRE